MRYDIAITAMTVFMEASGEQEDSQIAVLNVLLNRLKSGRWGKSLSSVCLWPYQFSCWNTKDGNRQRVSNTKDDDKILARIEQLVVKAMAGEVEDNTGGALFYLNPSLCSPDWESKMKQTAKVGRHVFYIEK